MNSFARLFLAFSILLMPALPQAFAQDSKATTAPAAAQDKVLTVFAAASMKNALDEVSAAYTATSGIKVVASYAASSALAKQLEQGAPADIFISADTDWMDYSIGKKTINEPTRVNLLGNKIVLIAPNAVDVSAWSAAPARGARAPSSAYCDSKSSSPEPHGLSTLNSASKTRARGTRSSASIGMDVSFRDTPATSAR